MNMNLTNLVKNNTVSFEYLRAGMAYYNIVDNESGYTHRFPVPLDDIGESTLNAKDKAIYFMRWIRKSISSNELVKI